jgi:uncharacterized membrane protein HdeD (DUF308 family)
MIQTLANNWWLLTVCGVLDAVMSVIYFSHAGHGFRTESSVVLMGRLALAAGACTVAAGIWRSAKGKCWLLVLNGLALGALGLVLSGIFGSRISFRTVALLIIVMAISMGVLALTGARTLRSQRRLAEGWLLGLAGAASGGFALVFVALGFRWIKIDPGSYPDLLWLGAYFSFSTICMLGLVLRLRSHGPSPSSRREALPPLGNRGHAH